MRTFPLLAVALLAALTIPAQAATYHHGHLAVSTDNFHFSIGHHHREPVVVSSVCPPTRPVVVREYCPPPRPVVYEYCPPPRPVVRDYCPPPRPRVVIQECQPPVVSHHHGRGHGHGHTRGRGHKRGHTGYAHVQRTPPVAVCEAPVQRSHSDRYRSYRH